MPRLRLIRAPDHDRTHLRRVQFRQLPEQVCRLRRRGYKRRLLLLRVHPARERQGWVSEDHKSGKFENGSVLPEEEF